uniref:Ig-like domain-containing protein n=1 Tax=Oryzias latipes TaxID=8090 RepID=A0A3P9LHU1_ORYLA
IIVFFFLFSLFPGEPIIAAPGDDVILPCRLDSQEDLSDFTIEWTKLEIKPDPYSFVCYYQFRQIVTEVMNESFIPRVSLNQDGLKRGDGTLKIRNVSLQDEGKYSCFIPGKNFRETVHIQSVIKDFKVETKSFFLFSLFPGEPIIAAPGDDVILPCRLDSQEDLSAFTIEWSKKEIKPDPYNFVCYYQFRQIVTEVMIESFSPRVSLNQDGLKRGDVTLKIRNVSLQDEGKYSCFIPGKNFRETVQGQRLTMNRDPSVATVQHTWTGEPPPPPPTQWCSSSSNHLFVFFRIKCTKMHFCLSGRLDIFLGIS